MVSVRVCELHLSRMTNDEALMTKNLSPNDELGLRHSASSFFSHSGFVISHSPLALVNPIHPLGNILQPLATSPRQFSRTPALKSNFIQGFHH